MELQYELTIDDGKALRKHAAGELGKRRSPWLGWLPLIACSVAAIVVYYVTRPAGMSSDRKTAELAGIVLFACVLVFLSKWGALLELSRYMQELYGRMPPSIEISVALVPEGIISRTRHGLRHTPLDAVRSVRETEHHVFIFTGFAGAEIIPKRAFHDAQHMQAFLDELAGLRAAAQSQSQV